MAIFSVLGAGHNYSINYNRALGVDMDHCGLNHSSPKFLPDVILDFAINKSNITGEKTFNLFNSKLIIPFNATELFWDFVVRHHRKRIRTLPRDAKLPEKQLSKLTFALLFANNRKEKPLSGTGGNVVSIG